FFKYRSFVRTYINNIIIFNNTQEEYLVYLTIIIDLLNKYYIYISTNKSSIKYPSILLLSSIIDREGYKRTEDYIKAF
ncbi:hypothetical protein QR685DRAFT_439022, partial [Neurospora intermedia]